MGPVELPQFLDGSRLQEDVAPASFRRQATDDSRHAPENEQEPTSEDAPERNDSLPASEPVAPVTAQALPPVPDSDPSAARDSVENKQSDGKAGTESLRAIGSLLDGIRRQAGMLVVELAVSLAERILAKAISIDNDWIVQNAESCLEHAVPNGTIKMRLNPEDIERVKQDGPPPWTKEAGGSVVLVADQELSPGDCILESDRARVDGRVDKQLENLRGVLDSAVGSSLFDLDQQ